MNIWRTEPVLIVAVVQAIFAVVVAFGVHVTDVQIGAVEGLIAAVLAVVVRSKVTPV